MIIVAARCAFDGGESLAGVGGAVNGNVGKINGVRILGIRHHFAEIPQTSANPGIGTSQDPGLPGVIGAEEAAVFGVNEGVHALPSSAARNRQAYAAPLTRRESPSGQWLPARAAIG